MNKNKFDYNKTTPTKRTELKYYLNLDDDFDNTEVPNQISENPSFPDGILVKEDK